MSSSPRRFKNISLGTPLFEGSNPASKAFAAGLRGATKQSLFETSSRWGNLFASQPLRPSENLFTASLEGGAKLPLFHRPPLFGPSPQELNPFCSEPLKPSENLFTASLEGGAKLPLFRPWDPFLRAAGTPSPFLGTRPSEGSRSLLARRLPEAPRRRSGPPAVPDIRSLRFFRGASGLPAKSGVYVVAASNGQLLDIGESKNIAERVRRHDRRPCWLRHAEGRPLSFSYLLAPEAARMRIERAWRQQHNPPCGEL